LQKYMNRILGPILLIVGLLLLNIIKITTPRFFPSRSKQSSLAEAGIGGSFMLGVIFALSFCPIAAALFFGSLIPLALNSKYGLTLSFFYGIGTGIPVLIFSICIALGVQSISKWFQKAKIFENYTRKITGIIFVAIGAYFIWVYVVTNFIK